MAYEIKITGIDNNKNKSIWLNYDINLKDNINLKENKFIRKKEKINLLEKNTTEILKINQRWISLVKSIDNNEVIIREKVNLFSNLIKKNIENNENMILEGFDNNNKIIILINILKDIKKKKICICGFPNFINFIKNKYDSERELFKNIDVIYNNELFNIKEKYNIEGEIKYTISKNKKKTKIFIYDIIIFEEISIEKNISKNFIENNIDNIGLCIILRDNNKVFNKINKNIICINIDNSNSIKKTQKVTLLESQKELIFTKLSNLIYNEIKIYNNDLFNINILEKKIYDLIYKNKNNNLIINNKLENFYNFYINNKENSILITNKTINLPILEEDNLNINNEIIYINNNQYELDIIKNLYLIKKKLKDINYKDLIDINKTKKILLSNIKKKFNNKFNFYDKTMIEYNSQQFLNYIISDSKINSQIKNILNIINNNITIEIYKIETIKNINLEVLTDNSKIIINNNIKLLKIEIKNLYKYLKNLENSKSYIKYIIEGLWEMIYINRINIFTIINKKNKFILDNNFSLENYKVINKIITYKIKNLFINLSDIFNKKIINIDKLIFIYNCLTLYYDKLYIYI